MLYERRPLMRSIGLLILVFVEGIACGSADPCVTNPSQCNDGGLGTCTGQCVDLPASWSPGRLLWLGPEGSTPPACPAMAKNRLLGYADAPPPTVECPTCTCAATTGSCLLPSMINANKAACPGVPGEAVPFDAPNIWDGACTAMDAVSSAASLLVPPPALSPLSECFPSSDPAIQLAGGATRALVCSDDFGIEPGACADPQAFCTVAKAPGFSLCVSSGGDTVCPEGWPDKHVVFLDIDECACSCAPPTGEKCSSTLSVYADGACSQLLGSALVSSDQAPMCIDTPPGSPFGSKSATPPLYQSGTCTPSLTKSLPVTLCCQP
jgi:hypothetical protein